MAEGLLRDALTQRDISADVTSAGFLQAGQPIAEETVAVLRERSIEPVSMSSRRVDADQLEQADLVLGMARLHVREAVVLHPAVFPRTFTLKELVRRGTDLGVRVPDEPVGDWVARAHGDRDHTLHLGDSPHDDVADPVGQSLRVFRSTADELEQQLGKLVELLWHQVTVDR